MDWGAFGEWVGKIEPGSWSEWVASILTAGSLLLGFTILRRDRQKDTRVQALRVLTWHDDEERQLDSQTRHSAVHVKNTSDLPVFSLGLITRPLGWWQRGPLDRIFAEKRQFKYKLFQNVVYEGISLEAGQEWIATYPFQVQDVDYHQVFLSFTDAAGVSHRREVSRDGRHKFVSQSLPSWQLVEYAVVTTTVTRAIKGSRFLAPIGDVLIETDTFALSFDSATRKTKYQPRHSSALESGSATDTDQPGE